MDYNVNYSDGTKTPVTIISNVDNTSTFDVALFGDLFLEYGQLLNEDILHLLEEFSCPEHPGSTLTTSIPNYSNSITGSYNRLLNHPTQGQLWYNSTRQKLYYFDGSVWKPITNRGDVAANWGVIADGFPLPRPINPFTGYVFPYSECIWSVSNANFQGVFDYLECATDSNAVVTAKYRLAGSSSLSASIANYLIIGIRGNANHGTSVPLPTPPSITPTNTATPTTTPTNTPSHTATPTLTPTGTHVPGTTMSPTPTNTPTISTTHTHTAVASSPTPTPSKTPTSSRTPSNTPTRSPLLTQSNTPTPTPSTSIPVLHVVTYTPGSLFLHGGAGGLTAGAPVTATTAPNFAAVSVSGGVAPYTYFWQYVSGTPLTVNTITSSSTIFSVNSTIPPCTLNEGDRVLTSLYNCKITDSHGTIIISNDFTIQMDIVNNNC